MNPQIYERSQHTVSRKNIDLDALKIMHRLIRKGYKAYLVGGGVRDLLLDKKPKDFDIATNATPKQIKLLFRNCRIIGKRFKLVHVFFKDQKIIEVSTFRDKSDEDIATLPKDNVYGDEVTDAKRRDLTINALFYDLTNFSIIDYVGGFKDLQKRIIRIIGNPNDKVIEDPVRMWRAIRHSAKCNFKIEPESKKAILANKDLMKEIPIMRIHDELKKDFCSGYSYEIFKLAQKMDMLDLLLPELSSPETMLQNEDNETSQGLQFVDNWIKKGENISLTSALTIFTISIKKSLEKNKYYNEIFEEDEDVDKFVATLFTKFFIPKKEKEQIILAIRLWRNLLNKDINKISAKALSRRIGLEEVKFLVWFTRNDEEILNKIKVAIKIREENKDYKAKEKFNLKEEFLNQNYIMKNIKKANNANKKDKKLKENKKNGSENSKKDFKKKPKNKKIEKQNEALKPKNNDEKANIPEIKKENNEPKLEEKKEIFKLSKDKKLRVKKPKKEPKNESLPQSNEEN